MLYKNWCEKYFGPEGENALQELMIRHNFYDNTFLSTDDRYMEILKIVFSYFTKDMMNDINKFVDIFSNFLKQPEYINTITVPKETSNYLKILHTSGLTLIEQYNKLRSTMCANPMSDKPLCIASQSEKCPSEAICGKYHIKTDEILFHERWVNDMRKLIRSELKNINRIIFIDADNNRNILTTLAKEDNDQTIFIAFGTYNHLKMVDNIIDHTNISHSMILIPCLLSTKDAADQDLT